MIISLFIAILCLFGIPLHTDSSININQLDTGTLAATINKEESKKKTTKQL